jgi:NMD protein affecting ribosome stability and mRNA decay
MTRHSNIPPASRRRRMISDRVHDTYEKRGKMREPTACPQCGAVYRAGRWSWGERPADAHAELCQACRRGNDKYPAGFITLSGGFLRNHKAELLSLIRNCEQAEKADHPMNRIMAIEEQGGDIVITTTDIHLPRRVGEALNSAYDGELAIQYKDGEYHVRVTWRRDA